MRTKYFIGDESLRSWCHTNGYNESYYKKLMWRIYKKCMTPEQAIEFKPLPAEKDQHARRLRATRRFCGWSEEEIAKNLTPEEGKKKGHLKRAKMLFKGKTLNEIAKENNFPKGALYWRVYKLGLSLKEALSYLPKSESVLKYNGVSVYKLFGGRMGHRITDRVRNGGWSLEQAINTPIDPDWRHKPVDAWIKKKIWRK